MNANSTQTASGGKPYVMTHTEIPKEISALVESKLGKGAEAHPAREDGSYKGRVLLNSDQYLVQSVGAEGRSAVVHRKGDVELQGSNLKWRDENKRMGSVDVQVHYDGDKGKVYPWDREREAADRLKARAESYAKGISDPKEREAFVGHMKAMLDKPREQQRASEPAKAQQKPEPKQEQQAEGKAARTRGKAKAEPSQER